MQSLKLYTVVTEINGLTLMTQFVNEPTVDDVLAACRNRVGELVEIGAETDDDNLIVAVEIQSQKIAQAMQALEAADEDTFDILVSSLEIGQAAVLDVCYAGSHVANLNVIRTRAWKV